MPDHELVIRITAPTAENGAHWATTIRDLVVAEYGDSMRLAFDGPRVVNAPGSTAEQLPDHILAAISGAVGSYWSTACDTASDCTATAYRRPDLADELRKQAARLHTRCRSNQKFTGQLCVCGCHGEACR